MHCIAKILAPIVLIAGLTPALADVFEMPDTDAAVSVTLPDDWSTASETAGTHLIGTSPNGAVHLHVFVVESRAGAALAADIAGGALDRSAKVEADPIAEETIHIAARRATVRTFATNGPSPGRLVIYRCEATPGRDLIIALSAAEADLAAAQPLVARILNDIEVLDN